MSGYISIAETQQQQPEAFFHLDMRFPPDLDLERLQINTSRIESVANCAGFSAVHVTEYQGDQTAFDAPSIGGMVGGGMAAAAGTSAAKKAERTKANLIDDETANLWPTYRRHTANIAINRNEMSGRIASRVQARQSDQSREEALQKAWTSELGTTLRNGLIQASKDSLLKTDWMLIPSTIISSSIAAGILTHDAGGVAMGAAYFGAGIGLEVAYNKGRTGKLHLSEKRWSALSATRLQPDRFALAALHASLPLVRSRK